MPDFSAFLQSYPTYAQTAILDDLRQREYRHLAQHVYLDYTGGGVYAASQIRQHQQILLSNTFGNPHSSNPTSMLATEKVEAARATVLDFFRADPSEYDVIFTANASGALKLVGESYPFAEGGQYLLTFDNHNSVNGIREFAHARGAEVRYLPVELPDLRISESALRTELAKVGTSPNRLFAYPAQSNFSGVQHPLEWVEIAHQLGWDVLVDAAAFAPTSRLDLSQYHPDFVPLSFYKMFGYPTGIGALLARREKLHKLHRPWFAGGTITVASVQANKFYMATDHAAFEDGTVDYLNIPAVAIGLQHLQAIGMETIKERVRCLTGWLLSNLTALRHQTGVPLVQIYGPTNTIARGGACAMNFYAADGKVIPHWQIEERANQAGISLRTGCFCNPGAGEIALGISQTELATCFTQPGHDDRLSIEDFRQCIDGKSTGAVRVSVGMVTTFDDIEKFLAFAQGLLA
ncbi:MAG TPA: aminotransferase class V-fold PLP-dependent enzyme [Anaerolineales bacterium]|nr:aminotransferase class V-fold PLP-dependent enzyme [Anaerolineales bacterium]